MSAKKEAARLGSEGGRGNDQQGEPYPTSGAGASLSEYAVIGGLLQDFDSVFPICQEAGITAASFTVERCANAWIVMQKMRDQKKPIELQSVAENFGGDAFDALTELTPMLEACVTTAHSAYYAQELRKAERRRMLMDAVRLAQERLSRGDGMDGVADDLRAAGEAVEGQSIGGPLVSTFPPIRFSTLLELEVKPEETHILGNGFSRRGTWSLFTGGTGTGKSVLIEEMAACVACGKSVFGLSVSRPFTVLLLTAEQDEETLKRDLSAIAEHENLDPALLDKHLQIHHAYALDGPELVCALDSELKRGGFDLLILDNYQAYSGATDMSDPVAWKSFITPLSKILKKYNAAMILVDHTGKPQDRKGWGRHDSVYLATGTSRKANGARTSMELYSPMEGDERYRLHFGKNPERAGIADDLGRMVRDVYLDRSPDATRPYWTPSMDQTDHGKMAKGEAEIVAHATAHPFDGIRKIADAVGVSKSQVANILKKHPLLSKRPSDED